MDNWTRRLAASRPACLALVAPRATDLTHACTLACPACARCSDAARGRRGCTNERHLDAATGRATAWAPLAVVGRHAGEPPKRAPARCGGAIQCAAAEAARARRPQPCCSRRIARRDKVRNAFLTMGRAQEAPSSTGHAGAWAGTGTLAPTFAAQQQWWMCKAPSRVATVASSSSVSKRAAAPASARKLMRATARA